MVLQKYGSSTTPRAQDQRQGMQKRQKACLLAPPNEETNEKKYALWKWN